MISDVSRKKNYLIDGNFWRFFGFSIITCYRFYDCEFCVAVLTIVVFSFGLCAIYQNLIINTFIALSIVVVVFQ